MSSYGLYPNETAARAAYERWKEKFRADIEFTVHEPIAVRRQGLAPAARRADFPERGSGVDQRMLRALAPDAYQAPEGAEEFLGFKAEARGLFDWDRPEMGMASSYFYAAWPAEKAG